MNIVDKIHPRPVFLRLPASGQQCPYTGLSRAKMNQLILPCPENGGKPPVRSISLGPAGKKGVRLIEYASLISYLRGHFDEQTTEAQKAVSVAA